MVALTQRPLLKLDAKTYFNCQRTIGLSTARLVAATDAHPYEVGVAPEKCLLLMTYRTNRFPIARGLLPASAAVVSHSGVHSAVQWS